MINLLISYAHWKPGMLECLMKHKGKYRLIIDSGAFTAWNTGREIKLESYCQFLDSIRCLQPFHAVQLDVFGNPEASYQNLKIMKDRGYDVMPVFTRGGTVDRLNEMYTYTDYIMFGGIVTGGSNQNYIKWFMDVNQNRKAHWLGFVNLSFIRNFKPESVDSSTWASAVRYGELCLHIDGKMQRVAKPVFAHRPSQKITESILSLKVSYDAIKDLAITGNWKNASAEQPFVLRGQGIHRTINALSWVKFSQMMEESFSTKIYLVCVGVSDIDILLSAQNHLEKV